MKLLFTPVIFILFAQLAGAQQSARHSIVFTSIENERVAQGAEYYYQAIAKDSAGRPLNYFVKALPGWLKFNVSDNSISGKAGRAGQYLVQLHAFTNGDTARQYFMLTVYDTATTNILCLGNSITNGTATFNSYRRKLWQLLHAANYDIDFVGSWNKHHMGGMVPNPDFDMDHDGHSGRTAGNIFIPPSWDSARGNINAWLQSYRPDIVLMELGTNDVFQCRKTSDVISDLTKAVDVLRNNNKQVKIFVAQIPPLGKQWSDKKLCSDSADYKTRIRALNKSIVRFATVQSKKGSPVIAVDQFTGVNTATTMYDDIHPNEAGEKIMAERWFRAIKGYLKQLK